MRISIAWLRGGPAPARSCACFILCWPNYACALRRASSRRTCSIASAAGCSEAQELGSYHLIELLGHGGMGEVWRAEHRLLARDAAIKLVRPEVLGARNEDEAQRRAAPVRARGPGDGGAELAAHDPGVRLRHHDEGTFYYVMELLAGRDLESLVREFGPLPAERAIFLLRQVCHSLADAHARGLVHRDIKPANIYVCRMGLDYDFVKVLDFGLVKIQRSALGRRRR